MNKHTRYLLQGLLLTCVSTGVLAASMDASNQEGISAGESANGTTRADPDSYFENYSSDAPQRGLYSDPMQTSSDIDVQGQKELTESDLGQTARESYVNNPADKLSYDSDMMKYSDEIRENANAITGVNGSQCVAQELNKTTYTTHACELANSLTQSCTRKATIVTTGSREVYSTQLVLDAANAAPVQVDNYWLRSASLVPDECTICMGHSVQLFPRHRVFFC